MVIVVAFTRMIPARGLGPHGDRRRSPLSTVLCGLLGPASASLGFYLAQPGRVLAAVAPMPPQALAAAAAGAGPPRHVRFAGITPMIIMRIIIIL